MRVLVTGCGGFIGRALCMELCRRSGVSVVGSSRHSANSISDHFESVAVGRISSHTDWSGALSEVKAVVHTVARVHVMNEKTREALDLYREVNVCGTLNLARQAANSGVRRFIFISSIKVNGEETQIGERFMADDQSPVDPYGISKAEAEAGLRKISEETEMEVVIIRPPLVYGPMVKANFASLIRFVARKVPLPLGAIHGNRRSLVALDNLIDLIITCLTHPEAANQTFLVSDGEDLSTTDLIRRIASAMGKPSRLIPIPSSILRSVAILLGKKDIAQRLCGSLQVDIEKTRRLLDWSPPISVNEGLHRAVNGM